MFCLIIPTLSISSTQVHGDDTVATVDSQATTYGDLSQYEWYSSSGGGNGPAMTNYGDGPAPDAFNVGWKWVSSGATVRAEFNGMVFASNSSGTVALDYSTGTPIYLIAGVSGQTIKLDDTYMLIGTSCYRIADGSPVWSDSAWCKVFGVTMSVNYDRENKMMWVAGCSMWSFADPSKPPTLVWNNTQLQDGWITYRDFAVIADGKVFMKLPGICVICVDEFTGAELWRANTDGTIMYQALYTEGKFIAGSLSGAVQAFDGDTGKLLWSYNPGGYWNFWSTWPAAAYGIFYEQNFDGKMYALNATTGDLIWTYQGPGHFYPKGPTVADGKLYVQIGNTNYRDPATGARGYDSLICLDAFTGSVVWDVDLEVQGFDSIHSAFGRLFVYLYQENQSPTQISGHSSAPSLNEVWCIVDEPEDWAMYGADASNSFTGSGPREMALSWEVKTGGAVTASPTIVDGVLYVGSYDYKIYAFDAYSGAKLWEFATGYQVKSSVAVVDGRVYTGIDDGFAYCLNADTGSQIWKTSVTSKTTLTSLNMGPQTRSSPKVVDGKVYVGSIDNNFYCLDAATGAKVWAFNSGGAILCSPAVVDGAVYFYANKPGANATFYKLNAGSGAIIWALDMPYLRTTTSKLQGEAGGDISAAPCVAKGAIYQAWDGGSTDPEAGGLYKINATTGEIIWNAKTYWTSDTVIGYAPMVYYEGLPMWVSTLPADATNPDGSIISYDNRNLDFNHIAYQKQDVVLCNDMFYRVLCLNATDGSQLWAQYVGREIYGLAVSEPGQFYATCESKAIYDFNYKTGVKTSYVEPPAQSWSNPSLYDGRLYVGGQDWFVRCYGEATHSTQYYSAQPSVVSPAVDQVPSETVAPSQSVAPIVTESQLASLTNEAAAGTLSTYLLVGVAALAVAVVAIGLFLVKRKAK
jgi:outer membrane protein assembly factor BamB